MFGRLRNIRSDYRTFSEEYKRERVALQEQRNNLSVNSSLMTIVKCYLDVQKIQSLLARTPKPHTSEHLLFHKHFYSTPAEIPRDDLIHMRNDLNKYSVSGIKSQYDLNSKLCGLFDEQLQRLENKQAAALKSYTLSP